MHTYIHTSPDSEGYHAALMPVLLALITNTSLVFAIYSEQLHTCFNNHENSGSPWAAEGERIHGKST
eukprot:scaffold356598_cov14-Prasinocladus_malaysianus.AAC.3